MSTEPMRKDRKELQAAKAPGGEGRTDGAGRNSTRDQEIRRRAYEIYLERGEQPGTELEDWLQAERELQREVTSHAQAG